MNLSFPTTAGTLGRSLGIPLVGDDKAPICRLAPLEGAQLGTLSFLGSKKYAPVLDRISGAVLLISPSLVRPELPLTYLVAEKPQITFAQIAKCFAIKTSIEGISPQAVIHPQAKLGRKVSVGACAVVSKEAVIGEGTVIYPHVYVGEQVEVGNHCEIYPHAVLLDRVVVGNRVRIYSGSVIGSPGFGLFETDGGREEIPQLGTVVVEDDVRIGANVTIDRATLGETRIGAGSKLDDQVHVGHNCQIGKNCVLCAFVGLAGSVVLEDGVILAGQVGVADHVVIGKGARMGAQSGTNMNLKSGETYFSSPAIPIKEALKTLRYLRKLPNLFERVLRLETKD
ncbi:MAG: UDP-3-O-(3-hydroxymyristoyl)glucosamine N-acyltransferase [Deltaproteobacteria bacterium]|nr:UDP-3-O-(3-hydroxymyristoyl)glucosamine N-acyltransferase [Deltaproteobacteria bacterium]